jgi:hypothetical protein
MGGNHLTPLLGDESKRIDTLRAHSKEIVLSATSGEKTIYESGDVFSRIGKGFNHPEVNQAGKPTLEMKIRIIDAKGGLTYRIKGEPKKHCLTQHQMIELCRNNKEELAGNLRSNICIFEGPADVFHICKVCLSGEEMIVEHMSFKTHPLITSGYYRLFTAQQ